MKLSDFKSFLSKSTHLTFVLPNGSYIPPHFHLTEVGVVTKKFVDCGGIFREESKINCQLWIADDLDLTKGIHCNSISVIISEPRLLVVVIVVNAITVVCVS